MMWYFEQKNMFGKWMPRTSAERPEAKSAAGTRREIRNVQEVPADMEGLPLGRLHQHFNTNPVPFASTLTDAEGLLIEVALHYGAEILDEDATSYGFKQEDLLRLMLALTNPASQITALADRIHADNVAAGWWTDLKTGEDLHGKRNVGEMLCLVHSEISEAMEGHRKRLPDDKLPHRPMLRVELIDAMIRILDLLGSEDNDTHPAGAIFQEKREYNAKRADHKPEARLAAGGKAF